MDVADDMLEQVFQTAADGMRVIGSDFTVLRSNQTFARLAGVDPDIVVGGKCYDTFPGPHCHTPECPLVRVMAGETSRVEVEVEKYRADGSHVPCWLTVQPFWRDGQIIGIIEDFRDITDRRRAEALIRHMAYHDQLTGLPNRVLFADRLSIAMANAERDGSIPALMFLDVDGFKLVNDTYGHEVGDEVLVSVARRLESLVRKGDTVARFGGDEFTLLLPHVEDERTATAVAEKALEGVSERLSLGEIEIPVSVSVGLALYVSGDSEHSLIRRADSAMYQAKEAGGGRCSVAPWPDRPEAIGA